MRILTNITQGSVEWFEIRRGVLTASLASNLLTPTGRPSSSADGIRHRLLAEKMGWQEPDAQFRTEWMNRGIEMEAEARSWLEFETGWNVQQVGFVLSDNGWVGCSPDGLIYERDGITPLEIKCPKPSTHMGWLEAGVLPSEHRAQVHFQMAILNVDAAAFVSYCPPMKPLILAVEADDYTEAMEEAIDSYCEKIQTLYDKLKGDTQ